MKKMIDLRVKLTSENWYQGHLIDIRRQNERILVIIEMGKTGLKKENLDLWLGILLHEIGHAIYFLVQKDWEYFVIKAKLRRFSDEETFNQEVFAWKFSLLCLNSLRNLGLAIIGLFAYKNYFRGCPLSWSRIYDMLKRVEKLPFK